MTANYFTDEQVKEFLRKLGFINLYEVASVSQLRALMNLAVETAIGEPVAEVNTLEDFDTGDDINTINAFGIEELEHQTPLYTIKKVSE